MTEKKVILTLSYIGDIVHCDVTREGISDTDPIDQLEKIAHIMTESLKLYTSVEHVKKERAN